jgi:ribonuclease BN (tRNA processing enzyme)
MADARDVELGTAGLPVLGGPLRGQGGLVGSQAALLDRSGATVALGEVTGSAVERIRLRLRSTRRGADEEVFCVLVRDAVRAADGFLRTWRRAPGTGPPAAPSPDLGLPQGEGVDPACFVHLGVASALLVNGVFGDPLLHVRLRQQRRSLLFDLGDSRRLAAKIAHQVSDVFISHAHMDHIGGFLWYLRSRIGETHACRLYGPPGLSAHICAFIAGIRWDRIGDRGPRFEISELHGNVLRRFSVQVGLPLREQGVSQVVDGILRDEAGFRIRAVTLDHGIPVLAFAFEAARSVAVRKERLTASGLPDGPWLGVLKDSIMAGDQRARVCLPDGRRVAASTLAADLLEQRPARRLVYATDLADSTENRERLVGLARGAQALICEAGFSAADAAQARRTGHLTARACGEIAAAAGVERLVPFHFSRRYESSPGVLYAEAEAAFGGVVLRWGEAGVA